MHRHGSEAWARNREALARALDVALFPGPIPWSCRAAGLMLGELPILALGRASPTPILLWVVRQQPRSAYTTLNQLIVSFGDERVIAAPPEDDDGLPGFRCPPLDGSCPLPALADGQRRDQRLAQLQARGLFEPVMLAPRFHELLLRRRSGPLPAPEERAQILSLLFSVRFWEATNPGHLRHPTMHTQFQQVPDHIQRDMRREPGSDGVVQYDTDAPPRFWVQVRCFPERLRAIEQNTDTTWWIGGFVQQWLGYDEATTGRTDQLWYVTLAVGDDDWRLARTLLWRRQEHGREMSPTDERKNPDQPGGVG